MVGVARKPAASAAALAGVPSQHAQGGHAASAALGRARLTASRLRLGGEVALAAGLATLVLVRLELTPPALPALYLAAVSPALVLVDLREHRLPDRMTLPGIVVALLGAALVALGGADAGRPLAAGGLALGLFVLLHAVGGMGLGDVKLAVVLAMVLGMRGWDAVAGGAIVAFLAGGVVSAVVLARGGAGKRIPFGPFLLLGFWVALLTASAQA